MITIDYINSILRYEPTLGKIYWRFSRGPNIIGKEAGTLHPSGYRYVRINGKDYRTHRLIWLLETGNWPEYGIDHINRIKDDNRFCNLRDIPQSLNTQNKGIREDNKTGFAGVIKVRNKFGTKVTVNGKQICLGLFDSAEEAHEAYLIGKMKYHVAHVPN